MVKAAILERSHLKSARVRQMQNIMEADRSLAQGVGVVPALCLDLLSSVFVVWLL